ncbi:MAG TPA: hypothetical protein VKG92_08785, partial [Flavobacteriales bacterium]|nr:hypothetical protein [Flavobacteriales bacterium]
MMRRPLSALIVLFALCANAQPFIDLLHANVLASPGLDRQEVSATVPLQLDTAGRLLVLDPYFI